MSKELSVSKAIQTPYRVTPIVHSAHSIAERLYCSDLHVWFLPIQATKDKEDGAAEMPAEDADQEAMTSAVTTNILWQMEQERKSEALSQFQDHMYREGFKMGKIQTQWVPL